MLPIDPKEELRAKKEALINQLRSNARRLKDEARDYRAVRDAARVEEAQAAQIDQANESSWSRQLGLGDDGFFANRVNDVASVVSGTTRLVGHVASLPVSGLGMAMTAPLTEEDYIAANKVKAGTATPEDMARLQRPILNGGNETVATRLADAEKLRSSARTINNTMDLSGIVNQTNRNALNKDLSEDFDKNWSQVTSGWTGSKPSDVVTGVAKLLYNAGEAAVNNPAAAREYILENAPQLLIGGLGAAGKAGMVAGNLGYAADNYQQGIENYQAKNGGQLPPEADRQRMAILAASLAAAESAGDYAGLAAGKMLRRGTESAADAAKTGVARSLLNTGKAGAEGFGTEALTEGYQTWAEGEVTGKPASAEDIYKGAVIGGLAGGGLSAGMRATQESFKTTPEHQAERAVEQAQSDLFKEAVKNNDPSVFLDESKRTYDPTKAVGVLFQRAQAEDATPELKAESLGKATEIIETLEAKKEQIAAKVDLARKDAKEETEYQINLFEQELTKLDPAKPEDVPTIEMYSGVLENLKENLKTPVPEGKEFKQLEQQLTKLNEHLGSARKVRDEIGSMVEPATNDDVQALIKNVESTDKAVSRPAAARVINLSMTAPEKIGVKAAIRLSENKNNGLTEEERTSLRKFTEARIAENALKTAGGVSAEIALGSTKMVGIAQYRERIGTAVKAGNKAAAARQIKQLAQFAESHQNKAKTIKAAFETGRSAQVVRVGKTLWRILPEGERWNDKRMKENGGFTVHPNSPKSVEMGAKVRVEADTLAKTYAQLKDAVAMRFGAAAVQSSHTPAAPNNSTPSPVSRASLSREKREREGRVDLGEPKSPEKDGESVPNKPQTTKKVEVVSPSKSVSSNTTTAASPSSQPASLIAVAGAPAQATAASLASAGSQQTTTAPQGVASAKPPVAKVESAAGKETTPPTIHYVEDFAMEFLDENVRGHQHETVTHRTFTKAEQAVLESVLNRLAPMLGVEIGKVRWAVMENTSFLGMAYMDIGVIGLHAKRFAVPVDTELLTQVIAHELGHIRDAAVNFGASQASTFQKGGAVRQQIIQAVTADPVVFRTFNLILNGTTYNEEQIPEELYAQLHAHFATNPEFFNENAYLSEAAALFANIDQANRAGMEADQSASDGQRRTKTSKEPTQQTTANNPRQSNVTTVVQPDDSIPAWFNDEATQAALESVGLSYGELNELSIEEINDELARAEQALESENDTQASQTGTNTNPSDSDKTVGEQVTVDPVKNEEGTLALFSEREPKDSKKPYLMRNQIAEHLVQPAKNEKGTQRPLAAVKNFLTQLASGQVKVEDFVGKGTVVANDVVEHFATTAKEWSGIIKAGLFKRPEDQREYFFNDLMQYFITEDTDLEENVKTAMSQAGYMAIADMVNGKQFNDDKVIRGILNLRDNAPLPDGAHALLGQAGQMERNIRASLGQAFISALGLKARKTAPIDILPQLEVAAGTYVVEMLLKTGMVERIKIPTSEFTAIAAYSVVADSRAEIDTAEQGTTGTNEGTPQAPVNNEAASTFSGPEVAFIRLRRNEDKTPVPAAVVIGTKVKESKGFMDKLFGTEAYSVAPTLDPQEYNQEKTRNSIMGVPGLLKKALGIQQNQGWKVNEKMFDLVAKLSKEQVLAMMGWKDPEGLQKSKQKGQQAKNNSLEREYDRFMEYVNGEIKPTGFKAIMYFLHDAWKNQRVGIKTNEVNPQTSKFHRQMMYKDGMESVIEIGNTEQENNLFLRIGEGLGVKVDKQANAKSLVEFNAKIQEPVYEAALAALNKHMHGLDLTTEDQAAIAEAVKAGGENTHTLSALTAMAQYHYALETEQDTVTVQLMGEVDGVTNGPMLTHLLMGAAATVENLFQLLNRGGFFEEGNPHDQYNIWRGVAGHLDLYETTALHITQGISRFTQEGIIQAKYSRSTGKTTFKQVMSAREVNNLLPALYTFTGELEKDGAVTKDGRNLVKTPLTALVFGSAVSRSIEAMAEAFVENIYDHIQKLNDGDKKAKSRSEIIESLQKLGIRISSEATIEDLMAKEFNKQEFDLLKNQFTRTIGAATKETLETDFESFISTRDTFNKTASMAYQIYDSAYKAVREAFIKELVSKGELPVNGNGNIIHELNQVQEDELNARLKKAMPILHTAMSSLDNDLDAGLYMSKGGDRQYNESIPYQNEVALLKNGKRELNRVHGFSRYRAGPGVAMFSASTHSSDSAIAHKAVQLVNALNVHDALSTGVNSVIDAGKALNKSTWEVMLGYSPATEVLNGLMRTMEGALDLIKNDPVGKQVAMHFAEYLVLEANRIDMLTQGAFVPDPKSMVTDQVGQAVTLAYRANSIRLGFLSQLKALSQYAIEGGTWPSNEQEEKEAQALRDEAKKQLAALKAGLSKQQEAVLNEFVGLINDQIDKGAYWDTTSQEYKNELPELPPMRAELPVLKISNAAAKQLLSQAKDSKLRPELKAQMALVYGGMKQGMDLETAIRAQLPPIHAGNMVQLLNQKYAELNPNQWGEVGAPVAGSSDPKVVAFMEERTDMTGKKFAQALAKFIRENDKTDEGRQNLVLLDAIIKLIPEGMRVKYVTPITAPEEVIQKADSNRSRGWYTSLDGADGVYILSPDYKYSGITVELLLHELSHAATAHALRDAETSKDKDAKALFDNIEALRQAVIKHVGSDTTHEEALVNNDEFLAWGLNNHDFQKLMMEVQLDGELQAQMKGNKFINAMTGLINSIVSYFFPNAEARRKELMTSAYSALVANAAGLFKYAAESKSRYDVNASMASPADAVAGLSTVQLYRSLVNHNGNEVTPEFNTHLEGLLGTLVEKLHGPFGTFKAELMGRQDISGREILAEAITSGIAPFASAAQALGMTEQESYVLEQVEATVAAALNDGAAQVTAVHSELAKLYEEMRDTLKPEHFEGLEQDEAQELYDFLFKIEAGADDKSDYLARFAAVALANQEVHKAMQIATKATSSTATGFLERLLEVFNQLVSFVAGKLTNTYAGQRADYKLGSLVQQLVDIEAKRRRTLIQREMKANPFESTIANASQAVRNKVEEFGKKPFFRENTNAFIRAAGSLTSTWAGDRFDWFARGMQEMRDENFKGKQGLFMGIVNEMRGANAGNMVFHFLLRAAKTLEGKRKDLMTGTTKMTLESFANGGKDLTQQDKRAISNGVLRTDMSALLEHYGMTELNTLVQNEQALDRAIKEWEAKLSNNRFRHYYSKQSKMLAYMMVTGDARGPNVMLNAGNIARLYETRYTSAVTEAEAQAMEKVIDPLVSLYAMKYTRKSDKMLLKEIFKTEMAREEGNGIELVLKMHKHMQELSKERLFSESPQLFMKGYTSEIYNPYKSVVVANEVEGAHLELQGWVKGDAVKPDENDTDQTPKWIYTLKDGGLPRRVSGTVSNTGMRARGTQMHNGNVSPLSSSGAVNVEKMETMSKAKRREIDAMFNPDPGFNPEEANKGKQFMVPVLNNKGVAANYRYMMKARTKDRVLDRDNRFEYILGTMAGSIFDKENTKTQNRKVIAALHAQYKAEYGEKAKSYVAVGPLSQDPEMREIYNLLPQDTKDAIREMFGKDEMMVRADLLDINFGYRKLSWADGWKKDEAARDLTDKLLITVAEYAFKEKAPLKVRQGQLVWQEMVKATKDNMVVKSFSTFAGNVKSNMTELMWFGVSPIDILKHHRVAIKGALDYRRDSAELFDLEQKLSLNYATRDRSNMERRIIQLKDAIARNPIKPLIDEGLMPTIVEDIDLEEDIYSYKSAFVRSTEKVTKHLNPHVVTAGKWALMTQDTPLYKAMSLGTQLSDFVARYTLYQHVTTRSKERMNHTDAVQMVAEAFVNYDIPSHRKLQAYNDDGFVWFTKYYLRIQKVIMMLTRENPGRALAMVGLENYFSTLPTLLDSSMYAKIDNNPFSTGATKYFSTLDDISTVKMIMSPFK